MRSLVKFKKKPKEFGRLIPDNYLGALDPSDFDLVAAKSMLGLAPMVSCQIPSGGTLACMRNVVVT